MAFLDRPALAGMLATILLASSVGQSVAGGSVRGTSVARAPTASLEAPALARHQTISQADYEQFMTCVGRLEAGIVAMKMVRTQQSTTEFDALISAGEGELLPMSLEFASRLNNPVRGFDRAAGGSARRAGRAVFDVPAGDARALAIKVRTVLVITTECASVFELVAERI